jgi:hypothetical protein
MVIATDATRNAADGVRASHTTSLLASSRVLPSPALAP